MDAFDFSPSIAPKSIQNTMKQPRLHIHIGTHKTGSTAIQHALVDNDQLLASSGLVYLGRFRQFLPIMTATQHDPRLVDQCRKELTAKVKRMSTKAGQRFIMSWEGLSGNPLMGYQNSGLVAQLLGEITADFDTSIIVYLRRQDEFVESMYTQKIHEGESLSFQDFIESLPPDSFHWQQLLASFADVFGKQRMLVRRYDKSFMPERESLFNDFCELVGIPANNREARSRTAIPNRGYSADALEIARLSNPYLDKYEKRQLRRILQQTSTKRPFDRFSYFSYDQRLDCQSRYAESNCMVASEYFDDHSGELFPDTGFQQASYQGLSLDAIVPVLVKATLAAQNQNASALVRLLGRVENKAVSLTKKTPKLLKSLSRKLGIF